jgi:hypothetical protein
VLSPAIDEIADAALWYESQRVGLGQEFWRTVDEVLSQIEETPFRFAESEFATSEIDLRFALIPRFKYVVHFLVELNECQVVSVAHAARKPGYWLRRARE